VKISNPPERLLKIRREGGVAGTPTPNFTVVALKMWAYIIRKRDKQAKTSHFFVYSRRVTHDHHPVFAV